MVSDYNFFAQNKGFKSAYDPAQYLTDPGFPKKKKKRGRGTCESHVTLPFWVSNME